ncbi:MAG: elongation factor G [Candidatus Eisenbacteria bacterium]|uniref:Elongation factor G n=1 Tax=Eiseniibacteriota bacterium TaxID=2212470 RepID=A0A956SBT1_UNCEI|nr:elongation factor G [Candidatus Eisenbacteria bacterium]MCB9464903.1 elongation factor G [Candidatus Eisenbacteria bacterium]
MKQYQPADIRNVVVVGHSGTGKTTLSESMLFVAGATSRKGKTSDGSSILDHTPEETKRKAGVYLSIAQFEAEKKKFNLLDAPGYADFVGEAIAGIRATDLALLVVNGQHGVEPDTDRMNELLDERSKSRFIVVNMMDKENVEFPTVMTELGELTNNRSVPVYYPIGSGADFRGVVAVLDDKAFLFDGKNVKEGPVPDEVKAEVEEAKLKLTELAAEADDELLEKYFETFELTHEETVKGLRAGITSGKLYPVIPVAAETDQGVAVLLSMIAEFGPSPLDVPGPPLAEGETAEVSESGSPLALVFKATTDLMAQKFIFLRVFSGSIAGGDDLHDVTRNSAERMGQLYNFLAKDRIEVEKLVCGDIGAAAKLKTAEVNHTIGTKNSPEIRKIAFPYPVHEMAIAAGKGDEEKLGSAFHKLAEEDPTFLLEVQSELHQTVLRTYGDQHLDVLSDRLKRKYNLEMSVTKPRVPFRETIRGNSDVAYRHKKQTGGSGQFADVSIKFEPNERGGGFEFVDEITGGVIPSKFIPSVEKGLREAIEHGVLAGYPVVDVRARLHFGGYHAVDSSEMAFKIASIQAFKKGMTDAQPVLLEPIWSVSIQIPDEYMGDVMGDISSRRGRISGMEPMGSHQIIKATVPQVELHRYSTTLRSMTQGRGRFEAKFSHYEEVPRDAAEKLVEELRKEQEAVAH